MNRTAALLTVATVVATAILFYSNAWTQTEPEPAALGPRGDVILVRCAARGEGFSLTAFQGSPGTPTVRRVECAETLSDLRKRGFSIHDIGYSADADFMVYTLVR